MQGEAAREVYLFVFPVGLLRYQLRLHELGLDHGEPVVFQVGLFFQNFSDPRVGFEEHRLRNGPAPSERKGAPIQIKRRKE